MFSVSGTVRPLALTWKLAAKFCALMAAVPSELKVYRMLPCDPVNVAGLWPCARTEPK